MPPSREYRDYLRGIRMFLEPRHQEMLQGEVVSELSMADLEALYELVIGPCPRARAPAGYRTARE